MSWSRDVGATPVADFPAALDVVVAEAIADAEASDYQPTAEATAQINAVGDAAKALVASGVVGSDHVTASLGGHAVPGNATDTGAYPSISIGVTGCPAPQPASTDEAAAGGEAEQPAGDGGTPAS